MKSRNAVSLSARVGGDLFSSEGGAKNRCKGSLRSSVCLCWPNGGSALSQGKGEGLPVGCGEAGELSVFDEGGRLTFGSGFEVDTTWGFSGGTALSPSSAVYMET